MNGVSTLRSLPNKIPLCPPLSFPLLSAMDLAAQGAALDQKHRQPLGAGFPGPQAAYKPREFSACGAKWRQDGRRDEPSYVSHSGYQMDTGIKGLARGHCRQSAGLGEGRWKLNSAFLLVLARPAICSFGVLSCQIQSTAELCSN